MVDPDYYRILEISRKATAREIRRAYRRLVQKYHPDLNPASEAAAQKFREIQEAYEVLFDPRKRKAYDHYGPGFGRRCPAKSVEQTGPPSDPAPQSPSDFSQRNSRWDFATGPVRSERTWALAITALGGRGVFALFFLGFAFLYFLWPDAGVQEFKRAQEALQHVKSWKMETRTVGSDLGSAEYLDEVTCPSSERVMQHMLVNISGRPAELTRGTLTVRNEHYIYNEIAKNWVRDANGATGPAEPCARLSRWFPYDDWLGSSYAIEKQGVRETADGRCRQWKIVTLGAPSSAQFVCLGIRDHLPRFQGAPGNPGERRFYDWNVPIDLSPPG